MVYRLKVKLPKHEEGEYLFLNEEEENNFYEWVEQPNYLLPKDVVEDSDEFYDKIEIDWKVGDKICYINSQGDIIEQLYSHRIHLKIVLNNLAFRSKEEVKNFLEKCKMINSIDYIICNKKDIKIIKDILFSDDKLREIKAINLLEKIIN